MLGVYSTAPPNLTYEPAMSANVSSQSPTSQQFEYQSAIDPALEGAPAPVAQYSQPGMSNYGEN